MDHMESLATDIVASRVEFLPLGVGIPVRDSRGRVLAKVATRAAKYIWADEAWVVQTSWEARQAGVAPPLVAQIKPNFRLEDERHAAESDAEMAGWD